MRRRGIRVGLCLLAMLCGLLFLRSRDPLGAALGRIRPGMSEAAVVAALGRPEDGWIGETLRGEGPEGRVLCWEYGAEDFLFVEFDGAGQVVRVTTRQEDRNPWERLRNWWPW
jgi:hypothetical protein